MDIQNYEPTTNQQKADIRFYCDNDDKNRLELVPDIPDDPNPNSSRTDEKQEWVDKINGMRHFGHIFPCHDVKDITFAYTDQNKDPNPEYDKNQSPHRAVITVSHFRKS